MQASDFIITVKSASGGSRGIDPHGAKEPPFGLDLVLSIDDRLNGTTLSG